MQLRHHLKHEKKPITNFGSPLPMFCFVSFLLLATRFPVSFSVAFLIDSGELSAVKSYFEIINGKKAHNPTKWKVEQLLMILYY